MPKSIFASKTMWVAFLTEVAALLQVYGDTGIVSKETLLVILPLLFALLRLMTNQPVSVTAPVGGE